MNKKKKLFKVLNKKIFLIKNLYNAIPSFIKQMEREHRAESRKRRRFVVKCIGINVIKK